MTTIASYSEFQISNFLPHILWNHSFNQRPAILPGMALNNVQVKF